MVLLAVDKAALLIASNNLNRANKTHPALHWPKLAHNCSPGDFSCHLQISGFLATDSRAKHFHSGSSPLWEWLRSPSVYGQSATAAAVQVSGCEWVLGTPGSKQAKHIYTEAHLELLGSNCDLNSYQGNIIDFTGMGPDLHQCEIRIKP